MGEKNAFTFALQFYMHISDILGGVFEQSSIQKSSCQFSDK